MAAKIKKGDKVVVLAGRDKGRTGEVIEVRPADEPRAGARHQHGQAPSAPDRRSRKAASSPRKAPIHLSNLALADPKDGKPTRVGFKFVGEGRDRKKVRVAKRSGVEIDG